MRKSAGTQPLSAVVMGIQDNMDSYYQNVGAKIDAEKPQPWFHPGQLQAWNSHKPVILVLAGRQSGKTVMAPWLTLREVQRRFEKDAPNDHLVVSPSFTLASSKLIPEYIRVFVKELKLCTFSQDPVRELRFTREGVMRLTGQPEGEIVIRFGYAKNSDSLESATYKSVVMDECGQVAFSVKSDEAIDGRLTTTKGRKFMLTTPYELGWLKIRYYDKCITKSGDRIEHKRIELVNFKSKDNPSADHDFIDHQESVLPKWKFRLFYLGMFERPAGAIYDCFDTELNVQRARWTGTDGVQYRFEPGDNWPLALGMDFGANNTAAVVLRGEMGWVKGKTPFDRDELKPTGRWVLMKSYLEGGLTVMEHTQKIKKELFGVNQHGHRRQPNYAAGGNHAESQIRDGFAMAGLPLMAPTVTDVEAQIQIVYQAIKQGKLIVHEDCQEVIDQILNYSRELDENGEPTEKIKNDAESHWCASIRYLAQWIFPMGAGDAAVVKAYSQSETVQSKSYVGWSK